MLILQVDYAVGASENYVIVVSFIPESKGDKLLKDSPQSIIARLNLPDDEGFLYDAVYGEKFRAQILSMIDKRKKIKGKSGTLVSVKSRKFRSMLNETNELPGTSKVLKAEQSNSSVLYDDIFFLKFYRRVEEGINPDPEVIKFLSEEQNFENVPSYAGSLEYQKPLASPRVLALLQKFTPNQGDAWTLTLDAVGRYFERAMAQNEECPVKEPELDKIFDIRFEDIPPVLQDYIGAVFFEKARLLGKRTAEMHIKLSYADNPDFAPEPFSTLYQKALYQTLYSNAKKGLNFFAGNLSKLPQSIKGEAEEILSSRDKILGQYKKILKNKISAQKISIHGDYHLGQILSTGDDFIIIDFEGEPVRSPGERRLKYSAFRDVGGMLRSFHYAVYSVFFQRSKIRPEDAEFIQQWIEPWFYYVSGAFLNSYRNTTEGYPFIPADTEQLSILLNMFLLDKSIYEIEYELNNRPDWVIIPMHGIKFIMKQFE